MQLAGVTEIAEMLNCNHEEAHALSKRVGFPQPVAELAFGRVWRQRDIQAWIDRATDDPADIVGIQEMLPILGVSERRVFQLLTRDDFPKPVATLAAGRVWRRVDIERWHETRDRRPGGRPRKAIA